MEITSDRIKIKSLKIYLHKKTKTPSSVNKAFLSQEVL